MGPILVGRASGGITGAKLYPPVGVSRRPAVVPAVVALLAVALLGLLVYGVSGAGENRTLDDAVKARERPAAPGQKLARPMLDGGGEKRLLDYRGGIVVLNFWASWCEPCRAEAPVLQAAHERLSKGGAGTVLGATFNDTDVDSRAFEKQLGVTYPSLRDIDTTLAEEFGTRNLPETFVLDPQGRVVAISRGQISKEFLDRAIQEAGIPR